MKIFYVLIITLTSCYVTVLTDKAGVDYCKLNCYKQEHTLCKYKKNESTGCTNVLRSGLNCDEKQTIVNLHNAVRQYVAHGHEMRGKPGPQPAAKYMLNLEWDEELALIAQRWAEQCNFGHDCHKVERFQVGQNVARKSRFKNDSNIEELLKGWYDEVDSYNGQSVTSFVGLQNEYSEDIGHYTQMVWAETTKIGCGFVFYKKYGNFVYYLVCNYGKSGNVRNRPVYLKK